MSECPDCHGSGVINAKLFSGGWERQVCHTCEGRGMLSSIKLDYSYISKPVIHLRTRKQSSSNRREKKEPEKQELWLKAQKRPVVIEFRPVQGDEEVIHTLEGDLRAVQMQDLIVRGVEGEVYPVNGKIFAKTYDVLPEWLQKWESHEPFWKSDLIAKKHSDRNYYCLAQGVKFKES